MRSRPFWTGADPAKTPSPPFGKRRTAPPSSPDWKTASPAVRRCVPVIQNSDQHSSDYSELRDKPRPGHADCTAFVKWQGQADMRGGGHFSGRLTAPLCIAGGIAKQILARRGIFVGAHLASVGTETDDAFPLLPTAELFEAVAAKPFPVLNDAAGERMQSAILAAREGGDSVGGVTECAGHRTSRRTGRAHV